MDISLIKHVQSESLFQHVTTQMPTTGFLNGLVEYRVMSGPCPDYGGVLTYGIQACQIDSNGVHTVAELADISSDYSFVETLVCKFNSFQLSPLHLTDAVLDHLP